jgi:hypothetical protein
MYLLVKPGGKLVILRPAERNRADSVVGVELTLPGFVRLTTTNSGDVFSIPHICRETRRKHRFCESEVIVFQRTIEDSSVITKALQSSVLSAADNDATKLIGVPQYAQTTVLQAYLRFHFEDKKIYGIKNFPAACADVCLAACKRYGVAFDCAMDAGCGPGRLGE